MKIIALLIPLLLVGCGHDDHIARDRKQDWRQQERPSDREHRKHTELDDVCESLFDGLFDAIFNNDSEDDPPPEPSVRPFEAPALVPSTFMGTFDVVNIPNVAERDVPTWSGGLDYTTMATRCSIRSPAGQTLGDVASLVYESISKGLAASTDHRTDFILPGWIEGSRTSDGSMDPARFSFSYYIRDVAGSIVVFTRKLSDEHAEVSIAIFECYRLPVNPVYPAK